MSANNQMVIVEYPDKYEIWMDGCVDNVFPLSASLWDTKPTMEEAIDVANSEYTEYGIRVIKADELLTEAQAEAEQEAQFEDEREQLELAISNGACPHCSTISAHTYHGEGKMCDRDPNNPEKIVREMLQSIDKENVLNTHSLARQLVERLVEIGFTLP